ncbi:MAG: hypothetical protein OEZ08_18360 [Betaproteobacteria bacterium]|nr:hypothetical protein [Betaproteobacteria bacterium]
MTSLLIAIASMFSLALLAWFAGRVLRLSVCPVCAGVTGTWLWMIGARLGGYAIDSTILAMLLGASAVGIAQWIENRLPQARSPLLWKALSLPVGFAAAYGLAAEHWKLAAAAGVVLALLTALFLRKQSADTGGSATVAELEERMKKCC